MTHTTFQPKIETLEDRTLMATCLVTRLSDSGAGMGFRGDLRYCINKTNALPGMDTINVTVTGTILLTGALPSLSTDMKVLGPGAMLLTIRRHSGGNYRIFTVPPGPTVRIQGLAVTNGSVVGNGGGIHNQSTLALVGVRVYQNQTDNGAEGGGIYNSGQMTIHNSSIDNNLVYYNFGSEGRGGGIANAAGMLTLTNTLLASNHIESRGDNSNALGGGLYNKGSATIVDSTIENNAAVSSASFFGSDAYGGGIYNLGPLTIRNSAITGNEAWANSDGDTNISYGGGIHAHNVVTIDNSTIANNNVFGDFGGGGGINAAGSVTITHSTITGHYQGIRNIGSLVLRNSIVAKNFGNDVSGPISNSGYNLIGNTNGGSGFVPSDILNVDPKFGPLQNHGGPTKTISLLPGSPAIDTGHNTDAPEFDQRGPGFPRIVNGTIDIGAFEVHRTPLAPPIDRFGTHVVVSAPPSENVDLFRIPRSGLTSQPRVAQRTLGDDAAVLSTPKALYTCAFIQPLRGMLVRHGSPGCAARPWAVECNPFGVEDTMLQ